MSDPRGPETIRANDGGGSDSLPPETISGGVASDEAIVAIRSLIQSLSSQSLTGPGPVILSQNNVSQATSTSIECPGPRAFHAFCTAADFRTRGVQAETWSSYAGSTGVYGVATSQTGSPSGVRGVSMARDGAGVEGEAMATDGGTAKGVAGYAKAGVGVLGLATATSGTTMGVWGSCDSVAGFGVLADNTADGLALNARGATSIEGKLEVGSPLSPASRSFTVDPANLANGETAILVRRNVGGTVSLQRVSVGAANSGGTGFRVLRVPN